LESKLNFKKLLRPRSLSSSHLVISSVSSVIFGRTLRSKLTRGSRSAPKSLTI